MDTDLERLAKSPSKRLDSRTKKKPGCLTTELSESGQCVPGSRQNGGLRQRALCVTRSWK